MTPDHPGIGDVVLASVSVSIGCIAAAAAIRAGYRSGNWFAFLCAAGCVAFVAGVTGQRTFPSAAAVTPVAVIGILVAALGLSLLLLFERIPDRVPASWPQPRRLEEDDSV